MVLHSSTHRVSKRQAAKTYIPSPYILLPYTLRLWLLLYVFPFAGLVNLRAVRLFLYNAGRVMLTLLGSTAPKLKIYIFTCVCVCMWGGILADKWGHTPACLVCLGQGKYQICCCFTWKAKLTG